MTHRFWLDPLILQFRFKVFVQCLKILRPEPISKSAVVSGCQWLSWLWVRHRQRKCISAPQLFPCAEGSKQIPQWLVAQNWPEVLHAIEIRGTGGNCSFSRKEGRKPAALQEGSAWNALYSHWEGELEMAGYYSKKWNVRQPCRERIQLQHWQCWIFVASCCKKGRAEEGRGKSSHAGAGKGRTVVRLLLLEESGPDRSSSCSSDIQNSCVGKRDSRVEAYLLLQADTSPRRVPTLLVSWARPDLVTW